MQVFGPIGRTSDECLHPQDNLAYIYGEKYGHDLVVNHSKFYIVLSIADNTWRLTFLYEDTTLLSGQKKANLEDALDGLFMASAKKMAKHVPHGA